MLFTFNTLFKDEASWRKPSNDGRIYAITAKRRQDIEHFEKIRKKYGIESNQVVVLERKMPKKSTTYCRESPEILRKFFQIYSKEIPSKSVFFRDAGDAYKGFCDDMVQAKVVSEWVK